MTTVRARAARARIFAITVLLLGLLTMFTWLFRQDLAITIGNAVGYLVFNTALCMLLAGIALNFMHFASPRMVFAQKILGGTIFLLAGITIIEHTFGINVGIDWSSLHQNILKDHTPGRMSLLTSVCFAFIGLAITFMHQVSRAWHGRCMQGLILSVIALSLAGIGSQLLQFEILFGRDPFNFMSIATSIAIMLTGLSLWLQLRNTTWFSLSHDTSPDKNILLSSAIILSLVAIITALTSFVSHQKALEKTLGDGLHLALRSSSSSSLIRNEILQLESNAETIATRPVLIGFLKKLNTNPQDKKSLALLERGATSFLQAGYTGITFEDGKGKILLTVGHFISNPGLAVTLRSKFRSQLLWKDQYRLNTRVYMTDGDSIVGTVITEQLAATIANSVENSDGMRKTGEAGLCAPMDALNRMACFPLRFKPEPFTPPRVIDREPLPMDYALKGLSGIIKTRDYRGQTVIAAHGPISNLGLGLVVKMDASELYEPIREQLSFMLLLIFFMVIAGVLLLYFQIKPLANRIVTSEQQLKLALEGSQLALFDWDLPRGIIYLSGQWQLMLGGPEEPMDCKAQELMDSVHPDDLPELKQQLRMVLKGDIASYDLEHRVKTPHEQWIWIRSRGEVVARNHLGRALRITGTNADISNRKSAELRLAHQATHDVLTGLPNRILFQDRLSQAMSHSTRNKSLMAVCYLDIDKFKSFNDSLGHAVGDALLKAFSRRLLDCVRAVDTVARLGGDEFAIILSSVDSRENACKVADKIVKAIRPEFNIEYRSIRATTSVGIAFYSGEPDMDADQLIKNADQALYEAKGAGRDNYQAAGGTPTAV